MRLFALSICAQNIEAQSRFPYEAFTDSFDTEVMAELRGFRVGPKAFSYRKTFIQIEV